MEATPGSVVAELQRIQVELSKAPEALFEAESALAEAENAFDRAVSLALLNADGTVPERQAKATLEAAGEKLARDLARAQVSRMKTKIKVLESAQMAVSVIGKQVELLWRVS
jgi:hypothetical protein